MKQRRQQGYALLSVMVTSFVLFSLLAILTTTTYRLRQQNNYFAAKLQSRAAAWASPSGIRRPIREIRG
jgi:type II secretory pathway component PulJ